MDLIELRTVYYKTDEKLPKRNGADHFVLKLMHGDKPLWIIHPDLELPLISAVEWNGLIPVKVKEDLHA